jgi:uncharacterized protein YqhQ
MMKSKILVGGQAVIEGVMMRVPGAYATAIRKPDGQILVDRQDFSSLTERITWLKKPLFRGVISLFESLKIGFKTLQLSADIAIEAENQGKEQDQKPENKLVSTLMTLLAFGLAIGLFIVLPLFLTTKLLNIERRAFTFNLVSGSFRILFFLIYLWLISWMKDVQRLFQYHGAEHKVVFAFENGRKLTVANVREFSTYHPRCGTSFIFIVLLVSILMFALIDSIIILLTGGISLGLRIGVHLLLIPLVAGVGYEFLKLSSHYQDKPLARWLTAPGLWLQRITTQPPSDEQLEIALEALKAAFGTKLAEFEGREYMAEAID